MDSNKKEQKNQNKQGNLEQQTENMKAKTGSQQDGFRYDYDDASDLKE